MGQHLQTSGQYTLSGISTSTLGTRTGKATLNSTNSDGSKPYCTRNYTVNPSQNDIVSISASVSPTSYIKWFYSFTVIGTRRSGSTVTLNTSQYSHTAFSNTTTGTKSVTFTYTGTNSDGSKPSRTISVSVVANPLDVTSCTLTLSPNPVIIGNSMSATVVGTRRNGTTFTMSSSQYTLSGISTSTLGTRTEERH